MEYPISLMKKLLTDNAIKEYFLQYETHILPKDILLLVFNNLCKIKQEYYYGGQLKHEYLYINRERNGTEKWWYENGQLKSEIPYVNGQLHGTNKQWYDNGQLRYEIPYVCATNIIKDDVCTTNIIFDDVKLDDDSWNRKRMV